MTEARARTLILTGLCALVAFVSFVPSLSCYFFADDFLCLDYLSKIFNGQPQLLLTRLFSPWQDDNIQLLYRPLGDVSLALDYLFWSTNAFGYHLTNVLLHVTCTVLVFFVAKNIFGRLAANSAPACLAALLFAVYPLHTENIIWIVGRLDILCTLFFLVSFLCFVSYRQTKKSLLLYGSLAAFWLALASKEIAIVLPVLLVAYIYLVEDRKRKPDLKTLFKILCPYAVLGALFMALRYCVLGTLIGGYTGTIGDSYTRSFARRLSDLTLYFLQFYPLNSEVIPQQGLTDQFMHALYIVAGIFLFIRIPFCPWSFGTLRRMLFAVLWLLITVIPTLQMMTMIMNLAGGRIFYLPSVATVMLFVLVLYPFEAGNARNKIMQALKVGACAILVVMSGIFGWICIRSTDPWIAVSNMILTLKDHLAASIDKLPENKKLLLVNLASNYKGAHAFYEFSELLTLMSPPLSSKNYADRIAALDWFAAKNSLNYSRLRRLQEDKDSYEIRRINWISKPELLSDISTVSSDSLPDKIDISWRKIEKDIRQKEGTSELLVSLKPPVPASHIEFIDVTVENENGEPAKWLELPETIQLDYEAKNGQFKPLLKNTERISTGFENPDKTYSFAAGECVDWITSGRCSKFILHLPRISRSYKIKNISLGDSNESPLIKPDLNTLIEGNDSVCRFKNGSTGNIYFDASKVKEAAGVLIEISKPRYVYAFFDNSVRCPQDSSYTYKRLRVNAVSGIYPLTKDLFPIPARYQIHACALDKVGLPIGKFSDPLTLKITKTGL